MEHLTDKEAAAAVGAIDFTLEQVQRDVEDLEAQIHYKRAGRTTQADLQELRDYLRDLKRAQKKLEAVGGTKKRGKKSTKKNPVSARSLVSKALK